MAGKGEKPLGEWWSGFWCGLIVAIALLLTIIATEKGKGKGGIDV